MQFRKNDMVGIFLCLFIILLTISPWGVQAQNPPAGEVSQNTVDTPIKNDTDASPQKIKAMDKAGESIGKGLDQLSDKASSKFGKWMDADIFAGINWLKLLFCLFLIFLVVLIERSLRWVVNSAIRKMPVDAETVSWRRSLLQALSKPLSLFIWSYGIYGALSPLYVHFLAADGSSLVHSVSQKAADIGGVVALF